MNDYTAGVELYIEKLKRNIKQRDEIISSQRHELALLAKYREEDKHARQLLDKNACQRRVDELEKKLEKANDVIKIAKLVNALAPNTVYALIEKVRTYE